MTFEARELSSGRLGDVRFHASEAGKERLLAIAGPPVSGLLFRQMARPLADRGWSLVLPELFEPPGPSRPDDLAARIAPFVTPETTLLVHGLALPIAFPLLARARARALVIMDGPLERPDAVSRLATALAARAPALATVLANPGLATRFLASSAALRRTVTNPYAMDRDIVALLSAPLLATRKSRRAVVEYLASIDGMRGAWPDPGIPVLVLWSAANLLYPIPQAPSRWLSGAATTAISLPEARFFSVEERPWEVAEAVVTWSGRNVPGADVTRMSRFSSRTPTDDGSSFSGSASSAELPTSYPTGTRDASRPGGDARVIPAPE